MSTVHHAPLNKGRHHTKAPNTHKGDSTYCHSSRGIGFFDGLLLTHWKTPHDTHCHASSRGGCVCSPAVHRCYAGSRCSGTLPRRLLAACGGFYGRLSSESATVSPCVHISDLCPHSGDTMYALGTHVDFGLPRASLFLCWHRQYTPCNVYARLRPLSYCGDDSVFSFWMVLTLALWLRYNRRVSGGITMARENNGILTDKLISDPAGCRSQCLRYNSQCLLYSSSQLNCLQG